MNVVLHQPEMPANTGNIGRTCTATGTRLHLICPLGFRLDEKSLKRAGLDYWKDLELHMYESLDDFYKQNPEAECWYFSSKVSRNFNEASYSENCFLMFGKETAGRCRPFDDKNDKKSGDIR